LTISDLSYDTGVRMVKRALALVMALGFAASPILAADVLPSPLAPAPMPPAPPGSTDLPVDTQLSNLRTRVDLFAYHNTRAINFYGASIIVGIAGLAAGGIIIATAGKDEEGTSRIRGGSTVMGVGSVLSLGLGLLGFFEEIAAAKAIAGVERGPRNSKTAAPIYY